MAEGADPLLRAWASVALCGLYETCRKVQVPMKNPIVIVSVVIAVCQIITSLYLYSAMKNWREAALGYKGLYEDMKERLFGK